MPIVVYVKVTPSKIATGAGGKQTCLVAGDTRRQKEQLHQLENQRHETQHVGVRQQLHERPLIVLTDAVVYPEQINGVRTMHKKLD